MLPDLSTLLIVIGQIALLAEALRVVHSAGVQTHPSFLLSAFPMVAVDAHALRVVASICVLALVDLPLLLLNRVDPWVPGHSACRE